MTAKTSPARRAAFLAAVAQTGNQTLAAERAKVSRAWVQLQRSNDPAFRADLDAAVAAARARLRAADTVAPASGWRAQAGEELAVRGTNGQRVQVARARLSQWTPRVEKRFLDALAGCCNVKLACAAAGMSVQSAYGHRTRWPGFMQRWDEALEMGYDALEYAMIEAAGRMLDPDGALDDDIEPRMPLGPIVIADALVLLKLHQYRVHGIGKPPRWKRKRTLDEVRGSILRKLERVIAHGRHEERLAAGAPSRIGPNGELV